jgi:hypothetical protein
MPADVPLHVQARREQRQARLQSLGYTSYAEYLGSPHWQNVRRRYRESWLPQECICGDDDVQLHHMTYDRVGEERLEDLTPLCRTCHAMIHALEYRGDVTLDFHGIWDEKRAMESRAMMREAAIGRLSREQRDREEKQRAVTEMPLATRLLAVVDAAKLARINIEGELRVVRAQASSSRSEGAILRRIKIMEEHVHGWVGWTDGVDVMAQRRDRLLAKQKARDDFRKAA